MDLRARIRGEVIFLTYAGTSELSPARNLLVCLGGGVLLPLGFFGLFAYHTLVEGIALHVPLRVMATESDTRLSWHYRWARAGGGSGCTNQYSVHGVMAHEAGHTLGLGHASPERDHGHLTMSPKNNGPCQDSEYSLGCGDVFGRSSSN